MWFTEDLSINPGIRTQLQIERVLHAEKSEFQTLEVLQTRACGRMLVLDGIIMLTEFDEHSYHEMICHVPLFSKARNGSLLVIGGGDGGALREAAKHPELSEIHLCEIDRRVVEVSREHLPFTASGFDDPRVELHFEDGAKWVREHPGTYDVIIVDSTDPIGPGKALFEFDFYRDCKSALKDGGILVTQGENFLLHTKIVRELLDHGRRLFEHVGYYHTHVPTYPGGMIGFTFLSKGPRPGELRDGGHEGMELRHWSPDLHKASFVLPGGIRKALFEGD